MRGISAIVAEILVVAAVVATVVAGYSWIQSMQASLQAESGRSSRIFGNLPLRVESAAITTPYTWEVYVRNPNEEDADISTVSSHIRDERGIICATSEGFISDSNVIPAKGVKKIVFYGWNRCKIPGDAREWTVNVHDRYGLEASQKTKVSATGMGLMLWMPFESVYDFDWSGNDVPVHYYDGKFQGTLNGVHNGTLINGPQWVKGVKGAALQFDGVDDYVRVDDFNTVLNKEAITIAAWVYSDKNTGTNYHITSMFNGWSPGQSCFALWSDPSNGYYIMWRIQGTSSPSPSASYRDNIYHKWVYVTATYSKQDGMLKLYVDGKLVDTESFNEDISDCPQPLFIGRGSYWGGMIDEVRIYDRALTDEEVQKLYRGEDVREGLVLYLPFDENTGTTAYDWHNWSEEGLWLDGRYDGSFVNYVRVSGNTGLPSTITTPYTFVVRATVKKRNNALITRTTARSTIWLGTKNNYPVLHVDYNYYDSASALELFIYDINTYGKDCRIAGTYTPPAGPATICAKCDGPVECNSVSSYDYGTPDPAQDSSNLTMGAIWAKDTFYNTEGYLREARYYSRALSEDELRCVVASGDCLIDDENLVAMYQFDEPCTTYYPDTRGRTNKVCRAPPIRKDTDGKRYVEFNEAWDNEFWVEGTDFKMPKDAFSLVVNTAITKDMNGPQYTMIRKQCSFMQDGWTANITYFNVGDNNCSFKTNSSSYGPLTVGEWYTIGNVVQVGQNMLKFIDGFATNTGGTVTGLYDDGSPLGIGNWYSEWYNGKMKSLLIFSRPLTVEELNAMCRLFRTC
ncbi:MAG: hypothetical protein PWP76_292 [Candidatus Diapherotrites archaeon]|nr:hypothetical protein [Candidatus Diapherotrites archaeon]MDN5366812.1 hypothetical protein [Candidatus Diapherotrites archaeon]